ncbi:MAG: hypothetical protein Q9197_000451 [Variospora fuerteventurae]
MSPPNKPKAPAPTATQAPVCRGDPPVVPVAADPPAAVSESPEPELGMAPPPTPPPATFVPGFSLLSPSPSLLSSPVSSGIMLPDVVLIIMLSSEVAEPIVLEPIMEASDTRLEPVIIAESAIMEPDVTTSDAMEEAEVARLVTMLATS